MYLDKNNEVLRYALAKDINATPVRKLGVRQIHTIVSKLLGLLYIPNSTTICRFSNDQDKLPKYSGTILEKLWGESV